MESTVPADPKAIEAEKKRFAEATAERRDEIEELALNSLAKALATLEELRGDIRDPELLIKTGKFLMELTNINGKVRTDEADKLPTVIININRSAKAIVHQATEIIEDITPLELEPSDLMCTFNAINNELELELDA